MKEQFCKIFCPLKIWVIVDGHFFYLKFYLPKFIPNLISKFFFFPNGWILSPFIDVSGCGSARFYTTLKKLGSDQKAFFLSRALYGNSWERSNDNIRLSVDSPPCFKFLIKLNNSLTRHSRSFCNWFSTINDWLSATRRNHFLEYFERIIQS